MLHFGQRHSFPSAPQWNVDFFNWAATTYDTNA
jgi:hypothetical protein